MRVVVSEKSHSVELRRVQTAGSKAERMPPDDPYAFLCVIASSDRGRKENCLRASREASLVSWRKTVLGLLTSSSESTSVHFSGCPRPRTFHETREIVVLVN